MWFAVHWYRIHDDIHTLIFEKYCAYIQLSQKCWYIFICMYTHIFTCKYTYFRILKTYTYVYVHIHIYTYNHTEALICNFMCICVCVCVCVCCVNTSVCRLVYKFKCVFEWESVFVCLLQFLRACMLVCLTVCTSGCVCRCVCVSLCMCECVCVHALVRVRARASMCCAL